MKKNLLIITCLAIQLVAGAQQNNALRLWYDKPAVKWTEALPIGNGRLGAMVFGGINEEHLQFNEETLWTGGPRDYQREGAYRYLDSIRNLLWKGKQKEAEQLAEEKFMGLKSDEGSRDTWVRTVLRQSGKNPGPGSPALPEYNDSQWKLMNVPSYDGWEAVGFDGLDGAVWLRTHFVLPEAWKNKDLILDLNRIRDQDFTYVNGKLVGSMETTEPRRYKVVKDLLHPGENTIAVLVLNFYDKGGITGYKDTTRKIGLYPEGMESEKLALNKPWRFSVVNDAPPPVSHYQADYQPFGDIWIKFKHQESVTSYRRELDLAQAVSKITYQSDGTIFTREYLASQPQQVIALHFTADKKGKISFEAGLTTPHKNSTIGKLDATTLALTLAVRNGALKGTSYVQVSASGGSFSLTNDKIIVKDADEVTLYLTAGTNFKNYKDVSGNPATACIDALNKVKGKNFAQVKAAHTSEYQAYFKTFSIDLGSSANENLPTNERIEKFATAADPSLVSLFLQYGRYLLISSSRPGTGPANLQGIWNDLMTPPWGSKYTTNINAEMNYWPAELLNLSPMHEPLFRMTKELSETGKKTAMAHYHAPGWVLHHNTDLWRGTAPINASNHGIWVSGGAWLCHHLWEHYLFTGDKEFLKTRAYPIMKEAALFFNSFLVKDPKTGWLISTPSNSPENGGLVAGPTMDHQIIRDLFKNTIAAAEVLGADETLRKTLQEKYKQIAPNQVGRYGQLQEWLEDKDDPNNKHRHVSHLWGVYPGSEINWDQTPELMKAARQSLIFRGDSGTGWSLAWKINYWSRFKEGDHAFKMVHMLISPAAKGGGAYPNLFDAHPPFQIDGNFGGAAGIAEMLLQSHTGYIDMLPALPADLPQGTVNGLCARGGFVINLKWANGKLQELALFSRAGNSCILRYGAKTVELKTVKGKWSRFTGELVTDTANAR